MSPFNGVADALLELVAKASKEAIDEQNQAVESTAKEPGASRDWSLAECIDVWPAQRKGDVVSGAVGVDSDVPYASIEELKHPYLTACYDGEAPASRGAHSCQDQARYQVAWGVETTVWSREMPVGSQGGIDLCKRGQTDD